MFNSDEYYSRLYVLKNIGKEGINILKRKTAAVVGLGGLGSVIAYLLTSNGIGRIKLIDQDIVELSNINRQFLYDINDLRYPKVEVAYKKLKEINPEVKIEPIAENLNSDNAEEILGDVDIILDGLDNLKTRYIVNYVAVKKKIPYVFGSVLEYTGNVSVFYPPKTPCLNCIFEEINDSELPTCETVGIINTATSLVASIEVNEAIKLLINKSSNLLSKLLLIDLGNLIFDFIDILKNENCKVCNNILSYKPKKIELIWQCGSDIVNINPRKKVNINLNDIKEKIEKYFKIILVSDFIIVFKYEDKEISIFKNGRMLIKNVRNEEEAKNVYEKIDKLINI